jgi:hypothetical protein
MATHQYDLPAAASSHECAATSAIRSSNAKPHAKLTTESDQVDWEVAIGSQIAS